MATFVFDNGPLTHIAQGRALDALEKIAGSNKCVYPLVVASELGINRPLTAKTPDWHDANSSVLESQFFHSVKIDEKHEDLAKEIFAKIGGSGTNSLGEAYCMALAQQVKGIAVIDDHAGRIALDCGIPLIDTPEFFAIAFHRRNISLDEAAKSIEAIAEARYDGMWVRTAQGFIGSMREEHRNYIHIEPAR